MSTFPTPAENIRPLSTAARFDLVAAAIVDLMPAYGYSGPVADFALGQSALETGRFRSDLFLRANNAFGMRVANVRPQNRIGESNGYAVYNTVADSVADYFARQRAFNIPNTNSAAAYIAATVASGYATAEHYGDAWAGLLRDVAESDYGTAFALDGEPGQPEPDGGPNIGLLALLAAGLYIATK